MEHTAHAEKYCYYCMRPLPENGFCTCFASTEYTVTADTLKHPHIRGDRYVQGMPYREDERGILFIARDLEEDRRAVLCECRDPLHVSADHNDLFEEDGITWAVLPLSVLSLRTRVRSEGPLSPEETERIFCEIIPVMKKAHESGKVFGRVSADTLFGGPDSILDYDDTGSELPQSGFTAPEYYRGNELAAASDIYSLSAAQFYALTGITPPDAYERLYEDTLQGSDGFDPFLPEEEKDRILQGLSLNPAARPADPALYRVPAAEKEPEETKPQRVIQKRHIIAAALIVLVLLSAVIFLFRQNQTDNPWREAESGASLIADETVTEAMIRRVTNDELTLSLELDRCVISDAVLKEIAKADHITMLRLDGCTGFTSLDMFENSAVTSLTLIQAEDIDGSSFLTRSLANVSSLELIASPYNTFTEADSFLRRFPNLFDLRMNGFQNLNDLSFVTEMPSLTILDLSEPKVPGNLSGISTEPLSALENLSCFYADDTGITDLGGLRSLPVLSSVSLRNNGITDITPLAHHDTLETLNLSGNAVSDLSALSEDTSLRTLDLSGNPLSDITPLRDLTELMSLRLSGTMVNDAGILENMLSLALLDLDHTGITDLSFLSGHTELSSLSVRNTGVQDLTPLHSLSKLISFDAAHCNIRSLSGLENCTNLFKLDVSHNQIEDLSPLAGRMWPELRSLRFGYNGIGSIQALADMPSLEYLGMEQNRIHDLSPLRDHEKLTVLIAHHNAIDDISPLTVKNIVWLDLGHNAVTDTSVLAGMTGEDVTVLLDHNQISALTLAETSYERLVCFADPVTDLSVLGNCRTRSSGSTELWFSWQPGMDYTPVLASAFGREIHVIDMTDEDKASVIHQIAEEKGTDAGEPYWQTTEEADRQMDEFRRQYDDEFPVREEMIYIEEVHNGF